jgi:hypothetical protein
MSVTGLADMGSSHICKWMPVGLNQALQEMDFARDGCSMSRKMTSFVLRL